MSPWRHDSHDCRSLIHAGLFQMVIVGRLMLELSSTIELSLIPLFSTLSKKYQYYVRTPGSWTTIDYCLQVLR